MAEQLAPGTPEYQKAYDEEMQRLETTSAAPATTETIKPESEKAPEPVETETEKQLRKSLESQQKALRDTQRYLTRQSQKLAQLEREREAEKHKATAPALLKEVPQLDDAIRHVVASQTPAQPAQQPFGDEWHSAVYSAIPDVDSLLADPEFRKLAEAKKNESYGEWGNPLHAIRDLTELKVQHSASKAAVTAREAARKDFETRTKKLSAMSVPGGSGSAPGAPSSNEPDYANMPADEFRKHRAKVMGYPI